jgi:hypothetical protein
VEAHPHIVEHAQAVKESDILEGPGDPQSGHLVGLFLGDLRVQEADAAAGGQIGTGDHVEAGGLARAVGTDQAYQLAFFDGQAELGHCGQAAEALGDVIDY